jgi:exodeoxyribonuclease VII small subunit
VSKPVKGTNVSDDKWEGMPFEEALEQLESIVESMEAQDLPLEALLSRFEEGTKLAQVCQAKLAEAELKIQQLEKNTRGEMVLKPLARPGHPSEP